MIKATFYQVFMPIGFLHWVPGALLVIRVYVSGLVVKKIKNRPDDNKTMAVSSG